MDQVHFLLEFEVNQRVEIIDEEHEYYGSAGTITRLVGESFYVVELDLIDGEFEVSGDQIIPEIPF